ncbi:hypothetical protein BLAT2472_11257 [Burkholderia latens]
MIFSDLSDFRYSLIVNSEGRNFNCFKSFCEAFITTSTASQINHFVLMVEVSGIEPLTSCMPCKRSPS